MGNGGIRKMDYGDCHDEDDAVIMIIVMKIFKNSSLQNPPKREKIPYLGFHFSVFDFFITLFLDERSLSIQNRLKFELSHDGFVNIVEMVLTDLRIGLGVDLDFRRKDFEWTEWIF